MTDNGATSNGGSVRDNAQVARSSRPQVTAAMIAAFLADEASPPLHNFDGDAMSQWRLTAKATGPALKADDAKDSVGIGIKYFYMHYVEMLSRDSGDAINNVRIALIDEAGVVYSFVSKGIAQSVMQLVDTLGQGPYVPEVRVSVQEIRTRAGFRTLSLIPID